MESWFWEFLCTLRFLCHTFRGDLRVEETGNTLKDDPMAVALRSFSIIMSVRFLMLSDHILCCGSRLRPPSTAPCLMVLQGLLWQVTWPKSGIFWLLIVARRESCRPTKLLPLSGKWKLVSCSRLEILGSFLKLENDKYLYRFIK